MPKLDALASDKSDLLLQTAGIHSLINELKSQLKDPATITDLKELASHGIHNSAVESQLSQLQPRLYNLEQRIQQIDQQSDQLKRDEIRHNYLGQIEGSLTQADAMAAEINELATVLEEKFKAWVELILSVDPVVAAVAVQPDPEPNTFYQWSPPGLNPGRMIPIPRIRDRKIVEGKLPEIKMDPGLETRIRAEIGNPVYYYEHLPTARDIATAQNRGLANAKS